MQEIISLINSMSPYLLLGFLLAGLMHAFIPAHYYTRHLSRPNFASVLKAALFGIPLPLCSCGVIPTAMSLRREGASKGAVTSFLIATPQTGVDSIVATYSLMGLPFAIARPLAALLTSIFGGTLVNAFADDAAGHVSTTEESSCHDRSDSYVFAVKIKIALKYAFVDMMQDIGKWLVMGIVIAGFITVLIPDSAFAVFKDNTLASMLLVLAIAIPMYLCATGSIPIAVALMIKGLTPGAALVLLMAGPACNTASILVVRKVLGTRTLCLYLASIILGAVATGYAIDLLQSGGTVDFLVRLSGHKACCAGSTGWGPWLCSALLCLMLLNSLVIQRHNKHSCNSSKCNDNECYINKSEAHVTVYRITGMRCNHCRKSVENAVSSLPGVKSANADLENESLTVDGDVRADDICKAVEAIGFGCETKHT